MRWIGRYSQVCWNHWHLAPKSEGSTRRCSEPGNMQAIGSCDFSGLGAERLELLATYPPPAPSAAGWLRLLPVVVQSTRTAAPVSEDDLLDGFEQTHIVNFQPLPATEWPHVTVMACVQRVSYVVVNMKHPPLCAVTPKSLYQKTALPVLKFLRVPRPIWRTRASRHAGRKASSTHMVLGLKRTMCRIRACRP